MDVTIEKARPEDGAAIADLLTRSALPVDGVREHLDTAVVARQGSAIVGIAALETTAERYFPKFGFERIERGDVPASVQESVEFRSACPSSAVVMRKAL